jgi:hypothetical protein
VGVLAATAAANGEGILCTILLVATVIAFILALAEVLGFYSVGGTRAGAGRFGTLVVFVILLVVYLIVC